MKREGSRVRTNQNGSVLGFVIVGSVLVFLLLGGVFIVRQQSLPGEADVTAGPVLPEEKKQDGQKPVEEAKKPAEVEKKKEEKQKEEPKPAVSHARELPQTGLDVTSVLAVFLLAAFFLAFVQSRRAVASL